MNFEEVETKFVERIGQRVFLRIYWTSEDKMCGSVKTNHNAKSFLYDEIEYTEQSPSRQIKKDLYPSYLWPTHCDSCKAIVPPETEATYQIFHRSLYNTPTGYLEPGNMYWNDWFPSSFDWDNPETKTLDIVLPNNLIWTVDMRSSNCTKPKDRLHRCWIRHGDPEKDKIHVDKNGLTCETSGAGSIKGGNYHGFLHHGKLISCKD